MWTEPPKTKAEYYAREIKMPWMLAGFCGVLAIAGIVFCLFIMSPPENRGRQTKTDLRAVYAGIAAAFGVAFVVRAPLKTRRWKTLRERGKLGPLTGVSLSPLVKNGARPVRVTYEVQGSTYTIAEDMPELFADELNADIKGSRVLYDPQNPAVGEVLRPELARLPEK